MMSTIGEAAEALSRRLAEVLAEHLPQTRGLDVQVEIRQNDRKKRATAALEGWAPVVGELRVTFGVPVRAGSGQPEESAPAARSTGKARVLRETLTVALSRDDLIRALADAERRPGFDFVSLKWFRDLFLPGQAYAWDHVDRDEMIRAAVEDELLITYKVPNPKSPAFPVTAVRLNRAHPQVQAIVPGETDSWDFEPIVVRGEPVSATIIRDRR